jgi:hypothetical protein
LEVKPTGKESKESKEKSSQSSAAHLVEGLCEKVVEMSLEGLCSGVRSTLTGLTAVAIDIIAYLYTYASQSYNQPYRTLLVQWWDRTWQWVDSQKILYDAVRTSVRPIMMMADCVPRDS